MNFKKYESIVKSIVNSQGGFREKEILRNPHTYEQGGTWNDQHKVIEVLEIEAGADGYRNGFAIDLVTRSICG